jgi:hypothetical protein
MDVFFSINCKSQTNSTVNTGQLHFSLVHHPLPVMRKHVDTKGNINLSAPTDCNFTPHEKLHHHYHLRCEISI